MTVLLLGEEGKRKAIFLVLCMLLALAPVSNVNAEDIGDPVNLQAQDIVAVLTCLGNDDSDMAKHRRRQFSFAGPVHSDLQCLSFRSTYHSCNYR